MSHLLNGAVTDLGFCVAVGGGCYAASDQWLAANSTMTSASETADEIPTCAAILLRP